MVDEREKTEDLDPKTAYVDHDRLRRASQTRADPPTRQSLDFIDNEPAARALDRTSRAHDVAVMTVRFAQRFSKRSFGGPPGFTLQVQEPEETTAGGARSRQPIVVAPSGRASRTLVLGWLDAVRRIVEIRTHQELMSLVATRKLPVALSLEDYVRLGEELNAFARENGMVLAVRDPSEVSSARIRRPTPAQGEMSTRSILVFGLLLMVVGLCVGIGVYIASSP